MSLKLTVACVPLMVLALNKGQYFSGEGGQVWLGERFSEPVSQGLPAALEEHPWSQVCGGPFLPLPQGLLSFQASGPHSLPLGQWFSERITDYLGIEKAFDNADFQAPEVLVQSI